MFAEGAQRPPRLFDLSLEQFTAAYDIGFDDAELLPALKSTVRLKRPL